MIELWNCEGVKQTELVKKLKNVYKKDAVDKSIVSRWLNRIRDDNSQENDSNVMTPCKFPD